MKRVVFVRSIKEQGTDFSVNDTPHTISRIRVFPEGAFRDVQDACPVTLKEEYEKETAEAVKRYVSIGLKALSSKQAWKALID